MRGMDQPGRDALEQQLVMLAVAGLRTCGVAPRPQLHLFRDGPARSEHLGWVTTRRSGSAADFAVAVAGLGVAAALKHATSVLFLWEDAQFRTSLFGPGHYQPAFCTVSATKDQHRLTYRPYEPMLRTRFAKDAAGQLRVEPVPAAAARSFPGAALPEPVKGALLVWAHLPAASTPMGELDAQTRAGYQFNWLAAAG